VEVAAPVRLAFNYALTDYLKTVCPPAICPVRTLDGALGGRGAWFRDQGHSRNLAGHFQSAKLHLHRSLGPGAPLKVLSMNFARNAIGGKNAICRRGRFFRSGRERRKPPFPRSGSIGSPSRDGAWSALIPGRGKNGLWSRPGAGHVNPLAERVQRGDRPSSSRSFGSVRARSRPSRALRVARFSRQSL